MDVTKNVYCVSMATLYSSVNACRYFTFFCCLATTIYTAQGHLTQDSSLHTRAKLDKLAFLRDMYQLSVILTDPRMFMYFKVFARNIIQTKLLHFLTALIEKNNLETEITYIYDLGSEYLKSACP